MRTGRFADEESGATAIEFALILPLLIAMIVGTIEIGLVGLVANNLDNSLQAAARTIRVGDAGAPTNAGEFETKVCSRMFESQASCQGRLAISVRKFADFAHAQAAAADPPTGQFDKGAAGDIILVKATYQWPFFVPFFTIGLPQSGPSMLLLDARTTFKNEPYE